MQYTQENQQRTQEWFQKRIGRVTGSRAGAILGLSPWQKPEDVLRAMVREYHGAPSEFVGNPATEWGTKHERQAMLCFMREWSLHVEDVGFLTYGDWLGASPDGLTDDGSVLELKVPFGCRDGKPFKGIDKQPHYYAQLQLEMLCSSRQQAYFAQYRAPKGDPFNHDYVAEEIRVDFVGFNQEWWNENEPKLRAFHDLYVSELNNPAHLAPLRVTIDTDEARRIVDRIGEIDEAMHNLTEEKKAHMEKLVALAGEEDAEISGRKLTRTKDTTSVAYAKAIKELAPNADLSKWTTVRQGYWRLS